MQYGMPNPVERAAEIPITDDRIVWTQTDQPLRLEGKTCGDIQLRKEIHLRLSVWL